MTLGEDSEQCLDEVTFPSGLRNLTFVLDHD